MPFVVVALLVMCTTAVVFVEWLNGSCNWWLGAWLAAWLADWLKRFGFFNIGLGRNWVCILFLVNLFFFFILFIGFYYLVNTDASTDRDTDAETGMQRYRCNLSWQCVFNIFTFTINYICFNNYEHFVIVWAFICICFAFVLSIDFDFDFAFNLLLLLHFYMKLCMYTYLNICISHNFCLSADSIRFDIYKNLI